LFCSTEDEQHATSFLLSRQATGYDRESLSGLRFLFDFENLYEEIDNSLGVSPADAVIIDCFSDVFGQDLKDTQRIRNFLNPYKALSEKHQNVFVFLHHTGKRTENFEPSKNNLLSGQGLESKMRLVIELRQDHSNPGLRHLCIVKGNYLGANMKRESFVLSFNEQTFTFQNTHDRVPFELLSKPSEDGGKRDKYLKAVELKALGYTLEQIAKEIGYGHRGSVSKLLDEGKSKNWGNVS
jgi:RecA-family ATPase